MATRRGGVVPKRKPKALTMSKVDLELRGKKRQFALTLLETLRVDKPRAAPCLMPQPPDRQSRRQSR